MQKRYLLALIAAVFVLGAATVGWSLWGSSSLQGTIRSIGVGSITVVSQSNGDPKVQETSVEVNSATKLNDMASLSELKAGDQVKVSYREDGDKKVAVSIAKQAASVDTNGTRAEAPQGT